MPLTRRLITALATTTVALAMVVTTASASSDFGAPILNFGTQGVTRYTPSGATSADVEAMTVQPDGKILLVGSGPAPRLNWVARFLDNGLLDGDFASGGIYTFSRATYEQPSLRAIAVQPDNKILVGGGVVKDGKTQSLLIRLFGNGFEDTGFGQMAGFATEVPDGDAESVSSIAVTGGTIVTAGDTLDGAERKLTVRGYGLDGQPDATFTGNAAGAVNNRSIESIDGARTRILKYGNSLRVVFASGEGNFSALALDQVGSKEFTYGANGTAGLGQGMSLGDAVLRADGGIVFTGSKHVVSQFDKVSLAGVDVNGTPVGGFGVDGTRTLTASPDAHNKGVGLRTMSDGRLFILAGAKPTISPIGWANTIVTNENGDFDVDYGSGGVLSHVDLNDDFRPAAMELQAKDQALVAGSGSTFESGARYGLVAKLHGPDDIVPGSKISSPKKSKNPAKKLKSFSGTASPVDSVAKVEIALQRVDSKLLKKKKKCLWLSSNKAKFKQVKAKKKKCSTLRWLKASGTNKWSYKLKKSLPRGSYVLTVRATGSNGVVQAKPSVQKFKVT
jgi:hypothetical protein